jgi:hypothetical protein
MKSGKLSLILLIIFLFANTVSVGIAAAPDSIVSSDIKEADGTSGQDTNSGSGIKSEHIQANAITSEKIADGAITASKIIDGSIISTKLSDNAVTVNKVSDGAITTSKVGEGAVTGAKITDGAVTDAKISGVISGSKLGAHTHNQAQVSGLETALAGKADATHNHDVLYQQKYSKVAVVAQTGGDYADPWDAIMNNLSTWCGTPSAINPCLLKIMPGVYPGRFTIPNYVDVEGSGENVTIITGLISFSDLLVGNSELRSATIKAANPASWERAAIYLYGGAKLTNVSIIATDSSGIEMFDQIDSPNVLNNVTITSNTIGIDIWASQMQMHNVKVNAPTGISGGIRLGGKVSLHDVQISSDLAIALGSGLATISNSEIVGEIRANHMSILKIDNSTVSGTNALHANGGSIFAGNTKLDGLIIRSVGSITCVGVYDGNYVSYPNGCP